LQLKRKEKRGLLRDFAVVWYRIEPAEKPDAIGRNPQPVRSKWQNTVRDSLQKNLLIPIIDTRKNAWRFSVFKATTFPLNR
jgi:hypothetical protein